jgi:hypothetical protein
LVKLARDGKSDLDTIEIVEGSSSADLLLDWFGQWKIP